MTPRTEVRTTNPYIHVLVSLEPAVQSTRENPCLVSFFAVQISRPMMENSK